MKTKNLLLILKKKKVIPFTLLPHHRSLSDSIKETGIQTQIRWFFRDTSLPSSQSAGFPNKVVFLCLNTSSPIH